MTQSTAASTNEHDSLLSSTVTSSSTRRSSSRPRQALYVVLGAAFMGVGSLVWLKSHFKTHKGGSELFSATSLGLSEADDLYDDLPIEVLTSTNPAVAPHNNIPLEASTNRKYWTSPVAKERCEHVVDVFQQRAEAFGAPRSVLVEEYKLQSENYNVFFRATAQLFWLDFAGGKWANFSLADIGLEPVMDGVPLTTTSLYTWITGDQHLSNFGAWKNRGGEVVFSVNDFDEAAIYGEFKSG